MMFRRALAALISTPAVAPTPVEAARQQLREALASRRPAEEALQEAIGATARVRDVIRAAGPAEAEANAAATDAAMATREWAVTGARSDAPAGDQEALDRAADAQRRAHQARIKAIGAKAALPDVEQTEEDRRIALRQAGDQIQSAVGEVLLAIAEPQFAELERAREAYLEALVSLKSLHLISRSWGPAHPYHEFSSPAGPAIAELLRENEIHIPSEKELSRGAEEWADFAKRLATDPDAALSG
jgi:hypothetical protein